MENELFFKIVFKIVFMVLFLVKFISNAVYYFKLSPDLETKEEKRMFVLTETGVLFLLIGVLFCGGFHEF